MIEYNLFNRLITIRLLIDIIDKL